MIAALLGWLWPYIAGAAVAIAAGLGVYAKGRSDSTAKARIKNLEDDHAQADDLRRSVDRDLAARVRHFDDAGFRD